MRDPKLTFLIRCAYGAVWLALIWLMVRYVLVWLLPFLIALALAALLEPAVVLCRRRLHLRRGFTATVLSLVVLGTVAAGLVLLAMVLLRQVGEKLAEAGYSIVNADVTVMAQAPKISPYVDEMRSNIAGTLNVDKSRINIKGTTTERLGFVGRKEGIAAEAVCSISR